MAKAKKAMMILLTIIIIIFILLLAIYINHKFHLNKEQELLLPIGTMVEIDGHDMSIYCGKRRKNACIYVWWWNLFAHIGF